MNWLAGIFTAAGRWVIVQVVGALATILAKLIYSQARHMFKKWKIEEETRRQREALENAQTAEEIDQAVDDIARDPF